MKAEISHTDNYYNISIHDNDGNFIGYLAYDFNEKKDAVAFVSKFNVMIVELLRLELLNFRKWLFDTYENNSTFGEMLYNDDLVESFLINRESAKIQYNYGAMGSCSSDADIIY